MLPVWPRNVFCFQHCKGLQQFSAGFAGLDNLIDKAALGGLKGIGEFFGVFRFLFREFQFRISSFGDSFLKMISLAPLAPITAISAVGQALIGLSRFLQFPICLQSLHFTHSCLTPSTQPLSATRARVAHSLHYTSLPPPMRNARSYFHLL